MPVDKFGGMPNIYATHIEKDVSVGFLNMNFLRRNGSNTVTGPINLNGATLFNVRDPIDTYDVANKHYVDENFYTKMEINEKEIEESSKITWNANEFSEGRWTPNGAVLTGAFSNLNIIRENGKKYIRIPNFRPIYTLLGFTELANDTMSGEIILQIPRSTPANYSCAFYVNNERNPRSNLNRRFIALSINADSRGDDIGKVYLWSFRNNTVTILESSDINQQFRSILGYNVTTGVQEDMELSFVCLDNAKEIRFRQIGAKNWNVLSRFNSQIPADLQNGGETGILFGFKSQNSQELNEALRIKSIQLKLLD